MPGFDLKLPENIVFLEEYKKNKVAIIENETGEEITPHLLAKIEEEIEEKAKENFPFGKVRGMQKLLNLVEKKLYTTLGSDPDHPEDGCWLKTMIGKNHSSLTDIARDINREIKRVEEQIIRLQLTMGNKLNPEEKLESLDLIKIYQQDILGIWSVQGIYRVRNLAGETAEVKLIGG